MDFLANYSQKESFYIVVYITLMMWLHSVHKAMAVKKMKVIPAIKYNTSSSFFEQNNLDAL